ncbi:MAG: hypothetical protein HYR96_02665 [Deltaproteobacteria bacterium]|nr:hypothetical protein [Deltaproteobacteria bacterium]MBI3294862.1 hypothetical protein [Deltaproteobacteria bacterium]
MGFYFELEPVENGAFRETRVPMVFWGLYGLLGFALSCMLLASFTVLRDLQRQGSGIDLFLIAAFGSALAGFVGVGIKLVWVRKFLEFDNSCVRWGYRLGKFAPFTSSVPRSEIERFAIEHSGATPNRAPQLHGEQQYYIQGHFRLVLVSHGKEHVLDKSTHSEVLEPILVSLERWRTQR